MSFIAALMPEIRGVALRRRGNIDRGLGKRHPSLGHADALHGLVGGGGHKNRPRVGVPYVLACGDHDPARDEERVLPGMIIFAIQ